VEKCFLVSGNSSSFGGAKATHLPSSSRFSTAVAPGQTMEIKMEIKMEINVMEM